MEINIKQLLQSRVQVVSEDESKLQQFQEKAIKICKDFNIDRAYQQIIFRQAKKNMSFLEGKVALCVEKFGERGLSNKGHYLISLFRKNKPWIK